MVGLIMETQLSVVSIWTTDVAATELFYQEVIGLSLLRGHGGIPHFDLGGVCLVLLSGKPSPVRNSVPERFPLLAFRVENLDVVIERLIDHQVPFPWGIEQDSSARWVMVHDPAGNLIEMVEMFHPKGG